MESPKPNPEGYDLLDQFGPIFIGVFDSTMRSVKAELERTRAPTHSGDVALRQYLESINEDQRALKVARLALQQFAHSLFARLDESDVYHLTGKSTSGELLDLKRYSNLFAEETNVWCERHSEYGSLTNDILEMMEHLH